MKTTHFCLLILLSIMVQFSTISAQKKETDWKLEGDKIVDETKRTMAHFEKRQWDFIVKSADGSKDLIYFQIQHYQHNSKISKANPSGNETFYSILFVESGATADMPPAINMKKKVPKMLQDNKLIVNGILDEEAVKRFVMLQGKRLTEERDRLLNKNTTIIINNN